MMSRFFGAIFKNRLTHDIGRSAVNFNASVASSLKCIQPQSSVNCSAVQHSRLNSSLSSLMNFPLSHKIRSSNSTTFPILNSPNTDLKLQSQVRSYVRFNRTTGKRETVGEVLQRFYRLNWGIWIRTRAGRHRKIWTKRQSRITRLRQHIFTNSQQSWMLDKMVCPYWRKPKYYVDDPYEPYHKREEYWTTRTKPQP
ncbi:39S ribosomal protein L35, mitochondrial [Microplitis mediator]|uniref:39S ribosomal protein L35, mitochondrial n=1 Tax=Microplitis mediator TaxID=375433 RepID=UPI0025537E70|nr:39S ribosomal protein L35, mitochondrial [Microplitis mediator]